MTPKPQRRSIRFAIVAVVCLLLGAVTTVGVAWWCRESHTSRQPDEHPDQWPAAVPQEWSWPEADRLGRPDGAIVATGRGRTFVWAVLGGGEKVRSMRTDSLGWPFRALVSVRSYDDVNPPPEQWRFMSVRQGFVWSPQPEYAHFVETRTIPLMPLWPGFAVDTAVYAAVWYLLIFTPLLLIRAGRRWFRVSRGLCSDCGYDLKGVEGGVCPECGESARMQA